MRKSLFLSLGFLLLFPVLLQAAELKIGFFDIVEVLNSCDAYKAKVAEFQKAFEQEGKVLEKQRTDLQKKISDFQVQQQALSPAAREDRQVDLARQERDFNDRMNDFMRKRNAAEQAAQNELTTVIIYAANSYGKREKFSAVLSSRQAGAVWVTPALDITKAVLEEANKVWKEKPKDLFSDKPAPPR
jgi:Skp family chaperone for outer membrane proteins